MNFELYEENNIYETFIHDTKPTKTYAFSPKIYPVFDKVCEVIDTMPKKSSIYIGANGFYSSVYFYKCSKGIVYIFLVGIDGIIEYYLL